MKILKLINNRFKIKELIVTEEFEEGFLVFDLANNNKKSMLKLYDLDNNINVINYYIDNFIEISQVKHKNLLSSYSFNLVDSLNLKKNNIPLYYSLAEYLERPVFRSSELDLNLEETMAVILDLMGVIDFLHFRGYIYQYLNPTTTFYTSEKSVKIVDLSTISEYKINSYYDDSIEGFTAPETFVDRNNTDIKVDYYSLGMMMKYLLLVDHLVSVEDFKFKMNLSLSTDQVLFLTNVINNLTNKNPSLRDIKLRSHMDSIIDLFGLDYTYDLSSERNNFYIKTKIAGRDKELDRLLPKDLKNDKEKNYYDLAIISGDEGDGKTKLLKEVFYKLNIKGIETYYIDVKENNVSNVSNIVTLIKETLKNTPHDIINKYKNDFSLIFSAVEDLSYHRDMNFQVEKFKFLNKITNYFKEISKGNKIYIIIDNFHKVKDDFVSVLDYIISNIDNNDLSIIIGLERNYDFENTTLSETINRWKQYNTVIDFRLERLNEEDIGKLTKSILGISYIPKNFSSILYKGSQGNPLYLEYIIKYLFNKGELYINKAGHWSLKTEDYSNLPIPSNINKAIEEQLNRIGKDDLEALKVISIFTETFNKQLLNRILNMDDSYLDVSLNNLIEERFIEKYDDFSFSIMANGWQRIISSRISPEEKQNLHKKTAEVILDEYGDNSNLRVEELILHLVEANDKERALEFINQQWEKLENKYSQQAIYLCEEAYKLVKDGNSKNKLNFLDKLIDIYSIKGNLAKTKKYLVELIEESTLQNDIVYIIKSMVYEASECLKENNVDKAYEIGTKVEKIARENNIPDGIINALIIKCRILLDTEELMFIEDLLNEAKELSYSSNNNKYLGDIYNLLGLINHIYGNTDLAISHYKTSIEQSINNNNMLEATKPMNNLAEIYSVIHGNTDMALYYYKRGLEIANDYGFTQSAIIFLNNLGELYKNSSDMHKALELFEESRNGAIKIGDYNMIFLANANLGSLYLSYNMMDKVYECYTFLEKEFQTNPISEVEIITQYNMFLGEFHEAFGETDLALEYFLKVEESCKVYNIRDYLRAKIKIILIRFMETLSLNEYELDLILDELSEAKLFYDRQRLLLYLSILMHFTNTTDLGERFLKLYDNGSVLVNDHTLNELRILLDDLVEGTDESLDRIERAIEISDNLKLSNTILYVYNTLGKLYLSKENYIKSTKCFLKSLDLLYITGKNIPKKCLYEKYIRTRDGDYIKTSIAKGLNKIVNESFEYKLETPNDLSSLIKSLPNDIFNKIFHYEYEMMNMNKIEDLISNLTEDYHKNIYLILEYIRLMTLSQKGHILKFDENLNDYVSIESIVVGDLELPNENILIQSNKSKLGLVLNKNMEDISKSQYLHYLKNDSISIICVPINIPLKSTEIFKDRRKRIYSANQNNKGYIYLQTEGSLNRFDYERLRLINSLSYLIYLNMENNNLKLVSSVDKLTDIFTRKYFEQKLVEILNNLNKTNESFSVLMLDIDNFKSVNDTFGHLKGDEVLSQVANTVKNSVRNTDLVGRYGGEEFIVLLSNSTITLGESIAEKIRTNIENMIIPGINRSITVSIGLSQYPNHGQFKDDLINKADQALYYSKNFMNKNTSSTWNIEMGSSYDRMDKLAGVLTGNTNLDNRNLLTILDMVELATARKTFKEKVHLFLGRTLDTIDGEFATLLLLDENNNAVPYGSRIRLNTEWVTTPLINKERIKHIIQSGDGEYIIDWDDINNISPLTGVPNWQSIMILPLIKSNSIKGILYISVPLDEREFEFNSFNLTKFLSSIFASNL